MIGRYTVVVGLLFLAVVTIALLDGVGGEDGGTLGLDRQERLWPLPAFAVPAASGPLEGDANIAQDDCETSRLPCPADARRSPACRLETPGAIRVCDLFDRPAVISFWFGTGGECVVQQDVVDRAHARYRDRVGFLSLDVRGDRDSVRDLVRARGWSMPVGYDRDGAVAGLYRVGGCPTFAYVYPGGLLHSAGIGRLDEERLSARIERLLEATRAVEAG